jgi:hypothetical protein
MTAQANILDGIALTARFFVNGPSRKLHRFSRSCGIEKLGFGKTATYESLFPDGRFSAWLQYAPDEMIMLKE